MPQEDTNKAIVQRPVDQTTEYIPTGINYLFVIAIDVYQHCPRLYNCIADAKQLIEVLTTQYFFEEKNVITLFDEAATEGNIFNAFRRLAQKVTHSDNLIIYFSGHGEYDKVFQEGYWIPVNAHQSAQEDFVSNSKIKTILEAINAKHTFLIADSCFSGSLFTQFKSASVAERLENDPSRWGLTAGRNEVVSDGKAGDHSPFADSLIYHLTDREVPIGVATLCNRVVENVIASADQTPRGEPLKVKGHRGGQFFFHPRHAKKMEHPISIKQSGTESAKSVTSSPTLSTSPAYGATKNQSKSSNRRYQILGGIAVLLLVLALGSYIFSDKEKPTPADNPKKTIPTPSTIKTDIQEAARVKPNIREGVPAKTDVPKEIPATPIKRDIRKARKNGKVGYVDYKTKALIIPYQYDMGTNFKEGVAFVRLNNRWALIDVKGEKVIDFIMSQPGVFRNGRAEVFVGTTRYLINPKGAIKMNGKEVNLADFVKRSRS